MFPTITSVFHYSLLFYRVCARLDAVATGLTAGYHYRLVVRAPKSEEIVGILFDLKEEIAMACRNDILSTMTHTANQGTRENGVGLGGS